MNLRLIAGAIIFPIAAIALWTAYHAYLIRTGPEVKLKVAAYDPRDLLSGHYLTYRVDYQNDSICDSTSGGPTCICLDAGVGDGFARAVSADSCVSQSCPLRLKGECRYTQFWAGIERFYIPEQYSRGLRVPEKSYITVRIGGAGQGIVSGFFTDGMPLIEYLRANPAGNN